MGEVNTNKYWSHSLKMITNSDSVKKDTRCNRKSCSKYGIPGVSCECGDWADQPDPDPDHEPIGTS